MRIQFNLSLSNKVSSLTTIIKHGIRTSLIKNVLGLNCLAILDKIIEHLNASALV